LSIIVTLLEESGLAAWQNFVDASGHAGPFHHAGWFNVLREAYSVLPCYLIARDERGEICGVLPAYYSNSIFTGRHITSLDGGILSTSPAAVGPLLDSLRALGSKRRVRYVQLRGGPSDGNFATTVRTVHTVINTARERDVIWASFRQKTRWEVRQAERQVLSVELDTTLAGLETLYRLYAAHMHELGTPVFGVETFRSMHRNLGNDRMRVYILRLGPEVIGGMVCLVHGNHWTDLYAIVRRSEATEFANYLLYWSVIGDAADGRAETLDLGRSAPGSTVLLFKHKWGGTDVDVPYLFYPTRFSASTQLGLVQETREKGFRQKIWSGLPLPVANRLGPIIRRDLPFL
jgi:hypothetical protein